MRIANRAGAALLIAALLTLVFVVVVFERDASEYSALDTAADHVHAIVDTAETALSALKDAETGQRGFLLTGDDTYLEPYHVGLREYEPAMSHLRDLTGGDENARAMTRFGDLKTRELALVIAVYQYAGSAAAQSRVRNGVGKEYMERFRQMQAQLVRSAEMVHEHSARRLAELEHQTRMQVSAAAVALFLFTLTGTLLLAAEIRHERRIAANLEMSEKKYRELAATLEQQVEARTENLWQLNNEMTAFSYSVSHDLRAPLRSIDGFSQIILEDYGDKLDATGADLLRRVRASAKRMGELIQSLLDLSRVTRAEPDRRLVSLSAIAERVLAALAATDPQRKVELLVAPDLTAEADPALTAVIFENLLGNAWKFTGHCATARIEVGQDGEGKFFVRDNGAGFDAVHADRLFTPFQRFHRSSEFEGTGIGLATVQRIIHRHGGTIRAESRAGEGATFYFTL